MIKITDREHILPSSASVVSCQSVDQTRNFWKKSLYFMYRQVAEKLKWISCHEYYKVLDSASKKAHTSSRAVHQKRCFYHAMVQVQGYWTLWKVAIVLTWSLFCQIHHAGNWPKDLLHFCCAYWNILCSLLNCDIVSILFHFSKAFSVFLKTFPICFSFRR